MELIHTDAISVLLAVVAYVLDSEEKHYEEMLSSGEDVTNHIYVQALAAHTALIHIQGARP